MFTPSLPGRHNVWKTDTVPTVPRDHVGQAKLLTTVTALQRYSVMFVTHPSHGPLYRVKKNFIVVQIVRAAWY